MEAGPERESIERPHASGGVSRCAVVLATVVFSAAAVLATWPLAAEMRRSLPDTNGATIRLFEALNGRSDPARSQLPEATEAPNPSTQAPSPFRVALDRLFGLVIANDILRYNLGFLALFVWAGLGTYALALHVLGDRGAAILAGLAVLMSGALRFHAQGNPELLGIGWVPITLVVWLRLLEQPSAARVTVAAVTGLAVRLTDGTIASLCVVPVLILTVFEAIRVSARSKTAAPRRALVWSGLILAPMLLYPNNSTLEQSSMEDGLRVPLWSYLVPVSGHRLAGFLPFNAYWEAGLWDQVLDIYSYLGILTFLLIHRSWTRRARMRHAGFLWGAFGLMVLLSLGDHVRLGRVAVPLPARWLWMWEPIFPHCGPPARFHLNATVFAAVIAGSGAFHLLNEWKRRSTRLAVTVGLCVLMAADLALLPFPTVPAPVRRVGDRPPATIEVVKGGSSSATSNTPPIGGRE